MISRKIGGHVTSFLTCTMSQQQEQMGPQHHNQQHLQQNIVNNNVNMNQSYGTSSLIHSNSIPKVRSKGFQVLFSETLL